MLMSGSLLQCAMAVVRKHERPPFRQSALAAVLRGALAGGARTTVIAHVAPEAAAACEAVATLRFAACLLGGVAHVPPAVRSTGTSGGSLRSGRPAAVADVGQVCHFECLSGVLLLVLLLLLLLLLQPGITDIYRRRVRGYKQTVALARLVMCICRARPSSTQQHPGRSCHLRQLLWPRCQRARRRARQAKASSTGALALALASHHRAPHHLIPDYTSPALLHACLARPCSQSRARDCLHRLGRSPQA
jgi:Kinesin motor domain